MLLKLKVKVKSLKPQFKVKKFLKIILFISFTFCIFSFAFAQDVPRFYGDEVVVTALRIPRLKSKVPWNTKLITRQEIEESSAVKLGDILRSVSGVSIKANGGLNSQISARFRGSNAQQVLVLLNGNRINSPSLGTFDLGDILLTDVERIEVVKAPLSALYGADAVGGVINIITQQPTDDPSASVKISYGEYSTQNFAVNAAAPNFSFSAGSLRSAGFRDNSDYKADNVALRLKHANVELGLKKYVAQKGSPGSLDFLTPQARQEDDNLFYDFSYSLDKLGFKATASRSILDQTYENPAWLLLSTHKTTTTNVNLEQAIDWFPGQTFLLGLDLRNDLSESTNSGNRSVDNKAVYIQDEIDILDQAKLVLGGRQDISSGYGNHFNPRIGCVFNPWEETFLKVSWGSSFKAPTIDDLFWARTTEPGYPSGVVTTEGNPNLRPETANSFEISLEKKLSSQSTAQLTFYQTSISDMIRWVNTSSSTIDSYWSPQNINRAQIQGVEFEYSRKIVERLSGFVNLTHQIAKDTKTDKFLDYAPQNQFNAGLKYKDRNGWRSNVLLKYVGERYTNLFNSNKLASYTVVDLSLAKEIENLTFKFNIDNLFGQEYAESYGFSDVYPMPGRRYNIGVSYKI